MSSLEAFLSHLPRERTRYSCCVAFIFRIRLTGWSRRRSRGGGTTEILKALFELGTAHFVAINEKADKFAHIIVFAVHSPGDDGFVAGGLEGKIDRTGALHR